MLSKVGFHKIASAVGALLGEPRGAACFGMSATQFFHVANQSRFAPFLALSDQFNIRCPSDWAFEAESPIETA